MTSEDKILIKGLQCAINLLVRDYCKYLPGSKPEDIKELYINKATRLTRSEELSK